MKSFKPSTGKKLAAFSFFMCMVVIGGMAVYYQYMKRQQLKSTTQTPTTEVQKLIDKDLDQGYPETPVEVMKLWGRYNQCLYNSNMTDEQREELVKKLMDIRDKPEGLENTELVSLQPHFLSCRTADGKKGLLLAVVLDEFLIQTPGRVVHVGKPVLAITSEPSALGEEYEILLNSRLLN